MGFKQRERKRMAKAAQSKAQRQARENGTAANRYWLTIVAGTTCCARCSGILRTDREMVYRRVPREALCLSCADAGGVTYLPSLRWERAKLRRSSGGQRDLIEQEKPKKARKAKEPARYRKVPTKTGAVQYIDSGWTTEEWQIIEQAMTRRADQ